MKINTMKKYAYIICFVDKDIFRERVYFSKNNEIQQEVTIQKKLFENLLASPSAAISFYGITINAETENDAYDKGYREIQKQITDDESKKIINDFVIEV